MATATALLSPVIVIGLTRPKSSSFATDFGERMNGSLRQELHLRNGDGTTGSITHARHAFPQLSR